MNANSALTDSKRTVNLHMTVEEARAVRKAIIEGSKMLQNLITSRPTAQEYIWAESAVVILAEVIDGAEYSEPGCML